MAKFLVSGATGKQGGAVVDQLLSSGANPARIAALVRDLSAPSAEALKRKGVTLARGSFEDLGSLFEAMQGISGAFLMTYPPGKSGGPPEVLQGQTFIDVAKKAGVKYLVFSSLEGADRKTGIPHFDSKFQVEEYLRASGIAHTIIRPVAFYENLAMRPAFSVSMTLGIFATYLKGKELQMVSTKDIGYFAAQALLDPAKFTGRIIALAGDSLTVAQMQETYWKVFDQSQSKAWIPGFIANLILPKEFKLMFQWFHDEGYDADIPARRAEHPGLSNFEQYLRGGQ